MTICIFKPGIEHTILPLCLKVIKFEEIIIDFIFKIAVKTTARLEIHLFLDFLKRATVGAWQQSRSLTISRMLRGRRLRNG